MMQRSSYDRLLELADEAARASQYEVDYHILMAALHLADDLRDDAAVERVGQVARRHGDAIEALRPPHPISRLRAQDRGQTALFDSLSLHVNAVRQRLKGVERV